MQLESFRALRCANLGRRASPDLRIRLAEMNAAQLRYDQERSARTPRSCGALALIRRGEGGAGGNRTLVQTTATCAFYMLSRFVGFRPVAGEGHPTPGLGPVSHPRYGPPRGPVLHDDTPEPGRRITGLPEGYSSTLLLFTWIKPHSLGLLSSERVVYFASYGFDALGYGPHITPGMLTHPAKPLSKPDRPQVLERTWREGTASRWRGCASPLASAA